MEFKLICTETAPGQDTVESSITVICMDEKDIDNAKQSICSFMDNKKVFRNTFPDFILNLKPCANNSYALKGAGRIIHFQTTDQGWDYSLYHEDDTIKDDPVDGGVLTNNLTSATAAMTICSIFGINPYALAALTPSENRAFFDL